MIIMIIIILIIKLQSKVKENRVPDFFLDKPLSLKKKITTTTKKTVLLLLKQESIQILWIYDEKCFTSGNNLKLLLLLLLLSFL